MPRQVADRARRQQIFLRALARGSSIAQACKHARLGRSTLYLWREQDTKFREAWDDAACVGADALAARFDSEMMRRAVEGVARPVFHKGEVVGERTRYCDRALMFGICDLRLRQELAPPVPTPGVQVVIEPLGHHD